MATMRRKLAREPGATDRDLRNSVASKHRRHIPADEWAGLIKQTRVSGE